MNEENRYPGCQGFLFHSRDLVSRDEMCDYETLRGPQILFVGAYFQFLRHNDDAEKCMMMMKLYFK